MEVEVTGPGDGDNVFLVKTVRMNPAVSGVVTGKQTYGSFLSSLLGAEREPWLAPVLSQVLILPCRG